MATRPVLGGPARPSTASTWLSLLAAVAIGSTPLWAMLVGGL